MKEKCTYKLIGSIYELTTAVLLIMDALNSIVYKGYMKAMGNWINNSWKFISVILEFRDTLTPHNWKGTCIFLHDVVQTFDLTVKL